MILIYSFLHPEFTSSFIFNLFICNQLFKR